MIDKDNKIQNNPDYVPSIVIAGEPHMINPKSFWNLSLILQSLAKVEKYVDKDSSNSYKNRRWGLFRK